MYEYMQSAEDAADQISKLYSKASRYMSLEMDQIFEKYQTKHNLSKQEAMCLINELQDKTSLDELMENLKNRSSGLERKEFLAKIEAPAYRGRLERLKQLMNQLDYIMNNIYFQEKSFSTSHYVDLANESYYKSMYSIQQMADAAFSFNFIDAETINRVINSKWSGKNYSKRIWENTRALARDLKEELLMNLVTGRTNREAADIIANKFAQGSSVARRLVRTESNYIATELNFKAYKESGIDEYLYLATLDLKTSVLCRELDGKIFPVAKRKIGTNCPPMHPWCRSTTISVISENLLKKMQRSALDPNTGKHIKVPLTMNYQEWYARYVRGKPVAEFEEKKIKNYLLDRSQWGKYRKLIGDDAPDTLEKFQDLKYNNVDNWRFAKLNYQRRDELLKHPDLKLPNAANAVAPEEKFTQYLFGGKHLEGLAKGDAIKSRLGYDLNNWEEFREEIISRASLYPSTYKQNNGYADMYEQKIILNGRNGTPANVIIGWAVSNNAVSMASAYIKEVK